MPDADAVDPAMRVQVREIERRSYERWVAGDLDGAFEAYAEGIALCDGQDDLWLQVCRTRMLVNRAKALRKLDRHDEALPASERAVEALRPLVRQRPTERVILGRELYEQYGSAGRVAGWHAAMRVLDEAIDELRTAADVTPDQGREWLAYALRWRGRQRYCHGGGDAGADIAEALVLFRALAADDRRLERQVAETLRWQARVAPVRRQDALSEALAVYRSLADGDPIRNLPDVAAVLSALVEHHAPSRRAREYLDEQIDVLRQLEELAAGPHEADLAAALLRRSRRPLALSDDAALADAREARRRWEHLDASDAGRHGTMVAETYRVESAILRRSGDARALAAAQQAVDRARMLDSEQDGAMLWRIVAMEDLVVGAVVANGYAAAVPLLDELMQTRRRYRPSPGDGGRNLPTTPMVRTDAAAQDGSDGVPGIVLDPALFGPQSNSIGMSEDVLVLTDERAAARRGVDAAGRRMVLVDENGHEYPSHDAVEAAFLAGDHEYTPNYVSEAIDEDAGIRLSADVKGEDIPPIARRWRKILHEELTRAGVHHAHLIPDPYPADEGW